MTARELFAAEHFHECRDCAREIPCDSEEFDCTWPGGNAGCYCDTKED